MTIKVGDHVKVTNAGEQYTRYRAMADLMKLRNFDHGIDVKRGDIGEVLCVRKHTDSDSLVLVGFKLSNHKEYIIGIAGIKPLDILPPDMFEL